jgi:DNA polymerase III subunit delta
MKYSNLRAFEKHLEGAAPKHFANIYLVLAKDAFERKIAVERIIDSVFKDQSSREMGVQTFDSEGLNIEQLLNELQALVFFSAQRIIVLQQAEKLAKSACEKLESYFAHPNRSICLVISASAINHSTLFYKKAEKAGVILEIAEEKPWEREKSMQEWLVQKAMCEGIKIHPQVCQGLLKQTGTDLASLNQEVEKLICYVGERKEITLSDLSAVCTNLNLESIWQLGEAIFRCDGAAALRIMKKLLNEGTAFLALLRQLRSQLQTDYQICSLLISGGSSADVAVQFPYMKGAILERHLEQSRTYGMQRFKRGLLKIDETEILAKNSSVDTDWLAENLIVTLVKK